MGAAHLTNFENFVLGLCRGGGGWVGSNAWNILHVRALVVLLLLVKVFRIVSLAE